MEDDEADDHKAVEPEQMREVGSDFGPLHKVEDPMDFQQSIQSDKCHMWEEE